VAVSECGERARAVLEGILARMGLESKVSVREEPERMVLEVSGGETGMVIGKKGQTLDALQFLMNKIINRDREGTKQIVVDSEGYRGRRAEALVALAKRLAEKVVRSGKPVEMEPMPPGDRRIVHVALSDYPGVSTHSEGDGPLRVLVIEPTGRRR